MQCIKYTILRSHILNYLNFSLNTNFVLYYSVQFKTIVSNPFQSKNVVKSASCHSNFSFSLSNQQMHWVFMSNASSQENLIDRKWFWYKAIFQGKISADFTYKYTLHSTSYALWLESSLRIWKIAHRIRPVLEKKNDSQSELRLQLKAE